MSAASGFRALIDPYLGILKAAVILAGVLGLIWLGMRLERTGWVEKQNRAIEKALDGERALQNKINQSTSDYINSLHEQRKAAHALPKITLVNDCAVPGNVGGVLNDAQRMHANASNESGVSSTSTTVNSTCAAELDIAKRNYAEVCVPNALQLNKLQEQWDLTRNAINKK